MSTLDSVDSTDEVIYGFIILTCHTDTAVKGCCCYPNIFSNFFVYDKSCRCSISF